jgi:hypothetical protein
MRTIVTVLGVAQIDLALRPPRRPTVTTFEPPVAYAVIHGNGFEYGRTAVLGVFRESNLIAMKVLHVEPDVTKSIGGQKIVYIIRTSRRIPSISYKGITEGMALAPKERPHGGPSS